VCRQPFNGSTRTVSHTLASSFAREILLLVSLLLGCCLALLETEVESILANATDVYTVLVRTNDAITAILPMVNLTLDQL
jgi:ABC-type arginine transport system permease subunit